MCDLDPKFNIRRRMAKQAFAGIFIVMLVMFAVIFLGDQDMRENLDATNGIIMMILGVLASLVAGYGASVSYDDIDRRKYE